MRVKGLTLVVHSHSRTAISIAHGVAKEGLAGGVFWRKRGASFRPFTAVSGTEPAPGVSKVANRGGGWIGPHSGPLAGMDEGMGGDHPAPFTAEGAESAEGEEGLALTPVSSTGQALGLSQDGSPHPRIEYGAGSSPRIGVRGRLSPTTGEGMGGGGEEGREMLHHVAFCCISACYCQVVRRWSRGDSRISLTGGWTGDGEGRIHRGGRRERRGRGGSALTPVSSTGQALVPVPYDFGITIHPHPSPLPGRERRWERRRGDSRMPSTPIKGKAHLSPSFPPKRERPGPVSRKCPVSVS